MTPGLIAGAVAAIIAVLVSLPLRSPSDTLLNSAAVALAALLAGVVAGVIWLAWRNSPARTAGFLATWSVVFLPPAALVVIYGRSQLDHFTTFAVPLALIIYVAVGAITVTLPRYLPRLRWWYAVTAVAVALAVGFGLATQGDQESGRLELPPPGSRIKDTEFTGPETSQVPGTTLYV